MVFLMEMEGQGEVASSILFSFSNFDPYLS